MKRFLLTLTAVALTASPVLANEPNYFYPGGDDEPSAAAVQPQAEENADLNGTVQYQNQVQPQQSYYNQPAARPELRADEYFEVSQDKGDLGKHSKKKYQAVTYTLKNTQPYHVELVQAEVPNSLDEAQVAQKKKKSGGLGLKMAGIGLGAASGFIPLGGGGIGAYRAASALGHASHAASSMARATSNGSGGLEITGQYVQRVNNVVLSPNQTFTFTTLLPKNADPLLKMVFKNLETNRIYDLTK